MLPTARAQGCALNQDSYIVKSFSDMPSFTAHSMSRTSCMMGPQLQLVGLQDAMLCTKALLDELQKEANRLRALGSMQQDLRKVLNQLLKLSHKLRSILADHHQHRLDDTPTDQQQPTLNHKTATSLICQCINTANSGVLPTEVSSDLLYSLQQQPCQLADDIQAVYSARIKKELLAVQAFADTLDAHQLLQLQAIIQHLRAVELNVEHQAELYAEIETICQGSDYSDTNFAYGSTTFASWLQVMRHPEVARVIHNIMGSTRTDGPCTSLYMVWGSSLGWLVFYGAVVYRWHSVGYDLLHCLTRQAKEAAQIAGLDSNARFHAADLLTSSLQDVGVLLLTNQCWDNSLVASAADKLKTELPVGAVVIEYTGSLGKLCSRLKTVAHLQVPVSWNEQQILHVYVCQEVANSS